jgi:hypothetical protein
MTVEAGFIQLDRMAVEKGLVAFAAAWSRGGALGGYSIGSAAVWADNMKSIDHGTFLTGEMMMIRYGGRTGETKEHADH